MDIMPHDPLVHTDVVYTNQDDHKCVQLSDEADTMETSKMMKQLTLDDVFQLAGGMGLYQWCLFAVCGILAVFSAESISMNFIGGGQGHWCKVPDLNNISFKQQKYIAIPNLDHGDYDNCHMFNLDYASYKVEDFLNWNRSVEVDSETPTISCDHGWVFDQSQYVNTVASRLDLVCHKSGLVPLISTFFMAGTLVGALGSGLLSDKYGRKTTLCACFGLKVCSSVMNAFPLNYTWVVATRFLMGIANSSVYLTGFIYVMEICTPDMRAILGLLYAIDFSLGFMMWSALAYFIRDDVHLQLVGSLPMVVLIVTFWWVLDESPRWLCINNRTEEAKKIMRKIARINKSPLPDTFTFDVTSHQKENVESTKEKKKTFMDILRSPIMLKQTIILFLHWCTDSLMYFALSLNTEQLFGNIYLNTFLSGAVEVPANIAAIFLLNWKVTGRRLTCALSLVIAGMASFVSIFLILKGYGLANTVFSLIAKCFVSIGFNSIFVFTSELYPTEVRNVGAGAASSFSRIGSMVAPFFGGLLSGVWPALPPLIYGSLSLLSGLVTLLLPETRGRWLFNTIEEAEANDRLSKTRRSRDEYERLD